MKKLSGRPFLLVEFIQRPKKDVNTKIKGWNTPNNMDTFEQVSVVDRIGSKQMLCDIIVDLVEGAVIRNNTNKANEEIVSYYIQKYEDTVRKSLKIWAAQQILENTDG